MLDINTAAPVRNLIERKEAQIKQFEVDMTRPDKDQTFSKEEYAKKINDIKGDIVGLKASLSGPLDSTLDPSKYNKPYPYTPGNQQVPSRLSEIETQLQSPTLSNETRQGLLNEKAALLAQYNNS